MKILTVILAVGCLSVALPANAGLPSKQAESNSIDTAHKEMVRLTGLSVQQQYDYFRCQLWFYESVSDESDFAQLTQEDKKELEKIVGERAFFLHRFTPKQKGGSIYEILVSENGATVYGTRTKPRKE